MSSKDEIWQIWYQRAQALGIQAAEIDAAVHSPLECFALEVLHELAARGYGEVATVDIGCYAVVCSPEHN